MIALKPGDIITEEPTMPGTVVRAFGATGPGVTATLRDWDHTDPNSSCRWEYSSCLAVGECTGHSWAEVVGKEGETIIRRVPKPVPASAGDAADELERQAQAMEDRSGNVDQGYTESELREWVAAFRQRAAELRSAASAQAAVEWEPIEAANVQVGDHIEVHLANGDGSAVITGPMTSGGHFVTIADTFRFRLSDVRTIRRQVRQPMPEPDAPAVVRHAGRVLTRSEHSTCSEWLVVAGSSHQAKYFHGYWLTWSEVLALDPATNPVLIDLGGGA